MPYLRLTRWNERRPRQQERYDARIYHHERFGQLAEEYILRRPIRNPTKVIKAAAQLSRSQTNWCDDVVEGD